MEIPVTESMLNQDTLVDVRIEERASAAFDLSGQGEYVDIQGIEGRLIVEYGVNRGEILDRVERGEDPGITDKLNAFLEDWSLDQLNPNTVELNYGRLLLRGTEPLSDVPGTVLLQKEFNVGELRSKSPDELKRDLRQEFEYQTDYDALESNVRAYLEREGISADVYDMGAPAHIQARAEPVADESTNRYGTEFRILVENKAPRRLEQSELRLSASPAIGREIELLEGTQGSYNPADEQFEFVVPAIEPGRSKESPAAELVFLVPPSAGRDLETVSGEIELNTVRPFSNIIPQAVFDAGGRKMFDRNDAGGDDLATIRSTCSIDATFHTETEDVLVGEGASVSRRLSIEGVSPPEAARKIEEVLRRRGIDATSPDLPGTRKMREGKEVTTFNGEFSNGSTIVGDTRIAVGIKIDGERRGGQKTAERSEEETLPTKSRNVTFDYGRTGIEITGRGTDVDKVDSYVSDLRDDLQMSLESVAQEV